MYIIYVDIIYSLLQIYNYMYIYIYIYIIYINTIIYYVLVKPWF